MTTDFQTIVIGAGVIGLAIAERLSRSGKAVLLLEQESHIGTQTSSRNSEVIHAGIYYPEHSLKAQLCTRGREMLYRFCEQHKVDYQKTGKYIIASQPDQVTQLAQIKAQAARNGVPLHWASGEHVQTQYPFLRCQKALYSPLSGIVDSHQLMLALLGRFESQAGTLALNTQVSHIKHVQNALTLVLRLPETNTMTITAKEVINCAGLNAWQLADNTILNGAPLEKPPRHLAKGHYYRPKQALHCEHLIYPVPEPGGLGVHITRDLGGQIKFGPDVQWVDRVDYEMPEMAPASFIAAVEAYFPAIRDIGLSPDYCGIRPKCDRTDNDFLFQQLTPANALTLINCFGIESPGLTACLAIADHVNALMTHATSANA